MNPNRASHSTLRQAHLSTGQEAFFAIIHSVDNYDYNHVNSHRDNPVDNHRDDLYTQLMTGLPRIIPADNTG